MQTVSEGLFRGLEVRKSAAGRVFREDWRSGEAEHMIALEGVSDAIVHLVELRAVAFVENQHHVGIVDVVLAVLGNKAAELLDGGDDDAAGRVLKLALENGGVGIAVSRTFLEAVVFLHRLIVKVFAVHYEEDFVYSVHLGGELRCLERGQSFAAACGVPDIPSRCCGSEALFVIGGDEDALQNLLRCGNLVGTHYQQVLFCGEDAELGEDIEQGVLCEKGAGKVHQIGYDLVLLVCPV